MTTVFVTQRQCDNHYCGCGGGHITGVFTVREEAVALLDRDRFDRVTEIPIDQFRWVLQAYLVDADDKEGWT